MYTCMSYYKLSLHYFNLFNSSLYSVVFVIYVYALYFDKSNNRDNAMKIHSILISIAYLQSNDLMGNTSGEFRCFSFSRFSFIAMAVLVVINLWVLLSLRYFPPLFCLEPNITSTVLSIVKSFSFYDLKLLIKQSDSNTDPLSTLC